jgi:hypothetical protein
MKLPHPVLAHCLAHGPSVTAEILRRTLPNDKALGYRGQVIVAALVSGGTQSVIDVFAENEMSTLVCGFLPGNTPDPWEDPEGARQALIPQMKLANDLAFAGVGPRCIVGPIHTQHRKMRPAPDRAALERWLKTLSETTRNEGLEFACVEPLNGIEDGTEKPFQTLLEAIKGYDNLFLQWDTGHAHWHGLGPEDLARAAGKVGYFELANVGRSPLEMARGIDFPAYVDVLPTLGHCELIGVEPFDQTVIEAFGLGDLCDTTTRGVECLGRDAHRLRSLGILEW